MGMSLSTGKAAAESAPGLEYLFQFLDVDPILRQDYKDVNNEFTLGKVISKAKFATIYICKEKSSGKKYACKQIPKKTLVTENQKENLKREVRIMEYLQGLENCVQLKGIYEDNRFVNLVMEHCEGGDLFGKMKSKGRYTEKLAAQILFSIMKLVYSLHFKGVMHRDLKPENFLLPKKAACPCFLDYSMLKATGFGLSVYIIDQEKQNHEKVGTAFYVAPEVIKTEAYGKEIDIWSAGVILYMLLSGVPPFYGDSERDIFDAVEKAAPDMESYPWPLISENAKSLVKAMLALDPSKRPTADVVLNDQWLKDNGVATENVIDQMIEKMKNEIGKMVLKKMKYLQDMNIFKKLTLKILMEIIPPPEEITPPEEIIGLRAMFKSFDPNEEQGISCEKLEESFVRIGSNLSPEDAKLIVKAADKDGNGYIDYNEFVIAMKNFSQYKEEHLLRAFMHFDRDLKGWISKEDLKSALQGYKTDDIEEIISQIDKNHDDKISFEEFCGMIRS